MDGRRCLCIVLLAIPLMSYGAIPLQVLFLHSTPSAEFNTSVSLPAVNIALKHVNDSEMLLRHHSMQITQLETKVCVKWVCRGDKYLAWRRSDWFFCRSRCRDGKQCAIPLASFLVCGMDALNSYGMHVWWNEWLFCSPLHFLTWVKSSEVIGYGNSVSDLVTCSIKAAMLPIVPKFLMVA